MKNKTNVKAAGQSGTFTLTAFLAIAALTMSLPAAGQDQPDKPQNQCKDKQYAAANPALCGKQTYQPSNSGSSSTSTPYQDPCANKHYAETHAIACRGPAKSTGEGGPVQTCENSCGPSNGNPPTLPPSNSADYGGGLGGESPITSLPPKHINAVKRKPANATALCHDGFYTATADRNAACSKHGGIDTWLAK